MVLVVDSDFHQEAVAAVSSACAAIIKTADAAKWLVVSSRLIHTWFGTTETCKKWKNGTSCEKEMMKIQFSFIYTVTSRYFIM